jgi:hypothetical protein
LLLQIQMLATGCGEWIVFDEAEPVVFRLLAATAP